MVENLEKEENENAHTERSSHPREASLHFPPVPLPPPSSPASLSWWALSAETELGTPPPAVYSFSIADIVSMSTVLEVRSLTRGSLG